MGGGYWRDEQSGVLRPVVERYASGEPLSSVEIAVLRLYCRQWIAKPFTGPEIAVLRETVDAIVDRASLDRWIDRAIAAGADPL